MIANHRKKKFWERTIAILSSSSWQQPDSRWQRRQRLRSGRRQQGPPELQPPDTAKRPFSAHPLLLPLPAACRWLNVKNFINLGAPIMSPTILKLLLTAMTLVSVASEEVTGGLQCYIDVEAKTIVTCNELEGFKTCFIKYNDSKYIPSAFPFGVLHQYQEATVVGRGCSTKDKVFYKECETHNYGDSLEKMCFCSFQLCNTSNQLNCPLSLWTLTLLVFLAYYTANTITATTVTTKTFFYWIWDPWPIPKSRRPCGTTTNVKKKSQSLKSSRAAENNKPGCSYCSEKRLLANEKIVIQSLQKSGCCSHGHCSNNNNNFQQKKLFSDIFKSEKLLSENAENRIQTVHSVQQPCLVQPKNS